ncbi:MAG TPA: DNA topoisomerase (ATP-hydrolyzing) subunit A [Bacteroidia bacterium]|nr:DNA topoisomerase (ATP-hydrolyzing) subunit A [Bacteroidia bacterium]
MATGETIIPVNIEEHMKSAYIDYSMSVIVSRALPDVRDGLKPVHRRVLFGMYELGVLSNRAYKKSAKIVGEVMGKYHPHGDASIYDTMVRMAQDWSLRYPLVDGQGNFGSVDGDSPAAMRYTEARLRKLAEEMIADIDKETVDFAPNYDDSEEEPTVLPSRIPNLLLNGSSGIAVGMATNMAPHNLTEVINATVAYIDNPAITVAELLEHKYILAPDFPTGGTIYGTDGVKDAFMTGRGRIVVRCKHMEEVVAGREQIVITEIPYMLNKAELIKKIADLVNDKKIEDIHDIRDESDRDGMRIVIELKKDAIPSIVINNLYRQTELQSAFNVNNVALVEMATHELVNNDKVDELFAIKAESKEKTSLRPVTLDLKMMIGHFVYHRNQVVVRRTQFDLREAEKRAHILQGLIIALDNLDAVIKIIRESESPDVAQAQLMSNFKLSEIQSKAILDMRLRTLTGLEMDKIIAEFEEIMKKIDYLKSILADVNLRKSIIKGELLEIKDKYGDGRRTLIVNAGADFRMEDVIADEDVVITISHLGYIKRTPLTEYRLQSRGGKGSKAAEARDEDFLEHMFSATNHNYLLFFTKMGKCIWMRAYEVPEGAKASKGRAIQNLLNLAPNDKIMAYINVNTLSDEQYINNNFIILCTKNGIIKKTSLEAYSRPRQNGINAITIREGDELLEARLTNGTSEMILALKSGKAIRFNESKVRPMGRNASGVKAITLGGPKDEVIGMICISDPKAATVLVVSDHGYGKRSDVEDYRITNRGGKGVKTLSITEKTGNLIAIKDVTDTDHLMIINRSGIAIRLSVSDLRVMGRATQGVRLINLKGDDTIAAVAKIDVQEDEIPVDGVVNPDAPIGDIDSSAPAPETPEAPSEE